MTAKVIGLHISNGGVPKLPVELLEVKESGCLGDKQNDLRYHGGTNKAVCIFQSEIIEQLNDVGHPITAGTTGENILISGISIGELAPGTKVIFPNVELIITQDAPPCKTIKESFLDGYFNAISHKKNPNITRWYAKVIKEGIVELDDAVEIIN
tara:strand:- start:1730 stop:2191 length:462 start_codon:yes stop_codon:yes gene_type:complete